MFFRNIIHIIRVYDHYRIQGQKQELGNWIVTFFSCIEQWSWTLEKIILRQNTVRFFAFSHISISIFLFIWNIHLICAGESICNLFEVNRTRQIMQGQKWTREAVAPGSFREREKAIKKTKKKLLFSLKWKIFLNHSPTLSRLASRYASLTHEFQNRVRCIP